jgi:hypothetical protein
MGSSAVGVYLADAALEYCLGLGTRHTSLIGMHLS